ncbi:MAG: hypothetical protein IPG86_09675 [Chitinophagaceae bacterium]|nr:hypothetical protein [Chitinophagaceae bacterium]
MPGYIKTKLLFEYKQGQLIGLGFGDIVHSDADIVILSAFRTNNFTPNSAIGSINTFLEKHTSIRLENYIDYELKENGFKFIDISFQNLSFKKLLIIDMGEPDQNDIIPLGSESGLILNNIKNGLEKAKIQLAKSTSPFTIDITALGTQYGGLHRKECFDLLINWASDLFNLTSKITLLRFIAYELDTFVDFFESVFRLQKIKPENELTFSTVHNIDNLLQFKPELTSALRDLDKHPRGVIITCRTIIETIVKKRLSNNTIKLSDGIALLKNYCPPNIYSYLTTCRILGNFSNHDPNFIPTRRDAEGILILTLRIVEWHFSFES